MKKGFTLIELLIVIGVLAILSVAVVLTLNPAELLRQARDSTRLSDLSTIKSTLALYLVDAPSPNMGLTTTCYIHRVNNTGIDNNCTPTGGAARFTTRTVAAAATLAVTTGPTLGWIPVDLSVLTATGAPISAWPVDPLEDYTVGAERFYAYAPAANNTYEINANLESTKYAGMEGSDGGNQAGLYEIGTDPGLDL